jgi:hypothetical protein
MRVNPMPRMVSQVGKIGIFLGFIDLNCGWYCQKAQLAYWFEVINGNAPNSVPLGKGTAYGYDPEDDIAAAYQQYVQTGAKPTTVGAWRTKLQNDGPVIVSGKLGAADWGGVRGRKFGVGHFILIVGASTATNVLRYKDPLQGNAIRESNFTHINKRIGNYVYWLDQNGAQTILNGIGAHLFIKDYLSYT